MGSPLFVRRAPMGCQWVFVGCPWAFRGLPMVLKCLWGVVNVSVGWPWGVHAVSWVEVHNFLSETPHLRSSIPHRKTEFREKYKCYSMNNLMA